MKEQSMTDYAELNGKKAVLHVSEYEDDGIKYQVIAAQVEGYENIFVLRSDKLT